MSLYTRPRLPRQLAAIYREWAQGRSELTLSYEEWVESHVGAWQRAYAAMEVPPDWIPAAAAGPSREACEGTRVVLTGNHCFVIAPGEEGPGTDLLAPYNDDLTDAWDQAGPSTVAEAEAAVPLRAFTGLLEDDLYHRRFQEVFRDCAWACHGSSPFWSCYGVLGFRSFMETLHHSPEVIAKLTERNLYNILERGRAAAAAGIQVMFIEECFSGADTISVEMYERLCWPTLRDMLAGLKELGLQVIFYPTGDLRGRLEFLAAAACDALALEENKKTVDNDLGWVRRELGPEMVILGNTDHRFVHTASAEELEAEVRSQYEAAGPRFIVSIGSPLLLETPESQVSALNRAAQTLR
jgi:hypothetical protein